MGVVSCIRSPHHGSANASVPLICRVFQRGVALLPARLQGQTRVSGSDNAQSVGQVIVSGVTGRGSARVDGFGMYEWANHIPMRGFQTAQTAQTMDGVPLGDMTYGTFNGLGVGPLTRGTSRRWVRMGTPPPATINRC